MIKYITMAASLAAISLSASAECIADWAADDINSKVYDGVCYVEAEPGNWIEEDRVLYGIFEDTDARLAAKEATASEPNYGNFQNYVEGYKEEWTEEELRAYFDSLIDYPSRTVLTYEGFQEYCAALEAHGGRIGILLGWEVETLGWPMMYAEKNGKLVFIDHNDVIDYIVEEPNWNK
jgi:hypothetical protein